ncbi:Protein of unknown function [Quadrisphaera granulorum]|uniref:Uncharacterized protein DUF2530 n=1 Tax=Quadrisphaera granulorum TaxID=317664 RepID=A0A316ABW8_9ACTN|nr:hypothetical protein [Quadrisphaera granulorum]PWJ55203.1 uncharacterized protein DUF2530 [Quadrisphaera granulorum]SZE95712.1 Protein of unknown function [Quadrisphaera granulorum]
MRFYLRREERTPAPAAPPTDDRRPFGVITLTWLALLAAAALRHEWLDATGRGWWLWTCAVGAGLGVLALARENHRRSR